MKLLASITLLALPLAEANCPNACSGHGTCSKSSLCDCFQNWMGADCSEQVCSFGRAYVDTPLGDLDGDGVYEPQAAWSPTYRTRVDSKDYIVGRTSEFGFGTYGYARSHRNESWDEAHFYRECSNKGICNRDTGVCDCFPGYNGGACNRAACPNDCSGHGVCRLLSELDSSYSAWDADVTQQCICDGGFTGPDCSKRKCPVGADPIENAQVIDWSIQGIYFRTMSIAEDLTKDFNNVVQFLEDKPEKVFYTLTFEDEYGDSWTTSVSTVDYLTECQTYYDGSHSMANCISTPDTNSGGDVHAHLLERTSALNTTISHLPDGVFPKNHVWAAAAELAHLDKDGAACNLADTGSVCGPRATIEQTSLVTFPIAGDEAYVDSLDYRLDLSVVSACDWDGDDLDFDGAETENFGLCFFVHMPSPGVRPALKVNYWYTGQGSVDDIAYSFSEVSGETAGFTADDDLHLTQNLVVVQDLQSKRVWNSADGDLELAFIDQQTESLDYCSKRGICDFESGVCNCFSGYSGLRCEDQNAVTYSF